MKLNIYKWLFGVSAVLCAVLFVVLSYFATQLRRAKADIRLTRDLVWRIEAECEHAQKGNEDRALQYLQMFDVPPDSGQLAKPLSEIISLSRKHALKEVIVWLRQKTGKDFGDDPKRWIEELR